ncbi:MAG: hypothetical protein J6Y64_11055 [Ruminococcus sp.]|nr:hypothetical protein [Ruminococcus sp.]
MNPLNSGNQTQNPKEQALDLMRQQGIAIPDGMGDNPQALIQYVMQSGRIPQGRLGMAQQIMQKMFRR